MNNTVKYIQTNISLTGLPSGKGLSDEFCSLHSIKSFCWILC